MLPNLTELLCEKGLIAERSLNYLGACGSPDGGTTTYLAFGSKSKHPLFAVKVHRHGDAEKRVENECDVMRLLSDCPKLADSVPKIIYNGQVCGVWVMVQSVIDGKPMHAAMGKDGIPDLKTAASYFQLVSDWLISMHLNLKKTAEQNFKAGKFEDFKSLFNLNLEEKNFLKEMNENLVLPNKSVRHGDFCRQNILVKSTCGKLSINVIDWTDSKLAENPFHDLFFFLSTYYLQARKQSGKGAFLSAFNDTFFSKSSYSFLVKKTLADYAKVFNISQAAVLGYFCLFLIEQALFEHQRLARYGMLDGLPRFTMRLAIEKECSFKEALKEQMWIYFFKNLVKERRNFIIQ